MVVMSFRFFLRLPVLISCRMVCSESMDPNYMLLTPLQSTIFDDALLQTGNRPREHMPDSMAVLTWNGELYFKSSAAFYVFRRMGGLWRLVAELGALQQRDWRW